MDEIEAVGRPSRLIDPANIPLPGSNESLPLQPEAPRGHGPADQDIIEDIDMTQIPLPSSGAQSIAGEGPHEILALQRTQDTPRNNIMTLIQPRTRIVGPESSSYMSKVRRYARYMPSLGIVSSEKARFPSAGKLVRYDFDLGHNKPGRKQTISEWNSRNRIDGFHRAVFEDIRPSTYLRLALVEDLSPNLMEVIGSVLNMSPECFEEHLRNSGYQHSEDKDLPGTWAIDASPKGYASMSWHRPVLPTLPLANLRSSLVGGSGLQASCISGCRNRHPIELTTNIFRRNWDLSSEPDMQSSKSQNPFPTAWEERMTFWTKQVSNCRIGNCFCSHGYSILTA